MHTHTYTYTQALSLDVPVWACVSVCVYSHSVSLRFSVNLKFDIRCLHYPLSSSFDIVYFVFFSHLLLFSLFCEPTRYTHYTISNIFHVVTYVLLMYGRLAFQNKRRKLSKCMCHYINQHIYSLLLISISIKNHQLDVTVWFFNFRKIF